MMMALIPPTPGRAPPEPLPARRTPPVELQAVGAHLEVLEPQAPEVQGALLELGDVAARLADQVVVMVLRKLVARSIPEVQPPHRPDLGEYAQGPIYRHQPNLGTTPP